MSGILGVSPNMKTGVLGAYPAGHVIQSKVKVIHLTDNASNYCSTTATAGRVINTASQNLEITGFSIAAGNILKVSYTAGQFSYEGAGNGIFGVKVDTSIKSCSIRTGGGTTGASQTCTVNFSEVQAATLSNVTIAAWMASPNTANVRIYHHDYTALYDGMWTICVQEIQQ